MIMSSKGKGRKTPRQHNDSHDAAPPAGIAAPEQNKEQINPYAPAGPTIHPVQTPVDNFLQTPVDNGFVAETFYQIEMGATAPAN